MSEPEEKPEEKSEEKELPGKSNLAGCLRFALIEVLVVLIGLVFVKKEVYLAGKIGSMILSWQEYALLILVFADGILRASGGASDIFCDAEFQLSKRKKCIRIFSLAFILFLFVSCASLCEKLNFFCVRAEWFRVLGVLCFAGGLWLLFWSKRSLPDENAEDRAVLADSSENAAVCNVSAPESPENNASGLVDNAACRRGPWRLVRYPARSAAFLELAGISLSLSSCLPILALPGLFVWLKWELADLEELRKNKFGSGYETYKKSSWHLIPYIY